MIGHVALHAGFVPEHTLEINEFGYGLDQLISPLVDRRPQRRGCRMLRHDSHSPLSSCAESDSLVWYPPERWFEGGGARDEGCLAADPVPGIRYSNGSPGDSGGGAGGALRCAAHR